MSTSIRGSSSIVADQEVQGSGANAGSGTAPTDVPTYAPDADAFNCVLARCPTAVRSSGFVVRIADAGDPGTTSALAGTLTAKNLDSGEDLSDAFTVCDHANGLVRPAGQIFVVPNSKAVTALPGALIGLVWNETGDIGDGARPTFQVLDWHPIAVQTLAY